MDSSERFPAAPILLVDDEPSWLHSLALNLEYFGNITNLQTCSDSREAIGLLRSQPFSLVLLDLVMPHIGGEDLLVQLTREFPQLPVIVLSGLNQLDTAVRCMRLGAFDYYVKTSEPERLLTGVQRALQLNALQSENRELANRLLAAELRHPEAFAAIVTRSAKLEGIFRYLEAIAPSPNPVLFVGEAGTGKRLLARTLQQLATPGGPCLAVSVAGLDGAAFSRAVFGADGWLARSSGGVLLLEDLHLLHVDAQALLADLLQQGELAAADGTPQRLQARLYSTSAVPLAELTDQCRFRRDLAFRLGTHQVQLPPLRERSEDLPLLLEHFLDAACARTGRRRPRLPRNLAPLLATYPFPGNLAQLRQLVEQAVAASPRGRLTLEPFRRALDTDSTPAKRADATESTGQPPVLIIPGRFPTLNEARLLVIEEALRRSNDNQTIAARLLGISQPALSIHLKKTPAAGR